MNLQHIIDRQRYDGIMAIGDVHADYGRLVKAVSHAIENHLFVVLLGDLIDGANYPLETVQYAERLISKGQAVFVIGNHDDKMYRWAKGNNVQFHGEQELTIANASKNDPDVFAKAITSLVTSPYAAHYFHFGNTIFTHGGVRRSLWDFPETLNKPLQAFCMYAEVDGKTLDENGYSVRTYNWTKDIPPGCQAVVGHDLRAMGKSPYKAEMFQLENNAKVFFVDSGCGKLDVTKSCLTGATFDFTLNGNLDFVEFKEFR